MFGTRTSCCHLNKLDSNRDSFGFGSLSRMNNRLMSVPLELRPFKKISRNSCEKNCPFAPGKIRTVNSELFLL